MKSLLLILLLISASGFTQSKKVLFIVNDATTITHSSLSYNILKFNELSQDSANSEIFENIKDYTFTNNDTTRYSISKTTLKALQVPPNEAYPFKTDSRNQNRFIRPDVDVISTKVRTAYDYFVTVNKVEIKSNLFGTKLLIWYTLFDSDWTEIIGERFVSSYNIKDDMYWSAFIQILWEPCESFEDHLLIIIDKHIDGYNPYGSSLPDRYTHKWRVGYIVNSDGDTLRGEVRYGDPYKVHYRISPDSPSKLLNAGDIRYFVSGSKKYIALFIHQISSSLGKYAFAEVLADGEICLYKLGDHDSKKYYIKRREDDKETRVRFTPDKKNITNKSSVKSVFRNNEEAKREIDTKNFGVKDLEKLVFLTNR